MNVTRLHRVFVVRAAGRRQDPGIRLSSNSAARHLDCEEPRWQKTSKVGQDVNQSPV